MTSEILRSTCHPRFCSTIRGSIGLSIVLLSILTVPVNAQMGGRTDYIRRTAAENQPANPRSNLDYSSTSRSVFHVGVPGAHEFEKGMDSYQGRARHAQDFEKARKQFCKGAKLGFPPAQRACGIMLALGQGGFKDEIQSADWLKKAAEQGDADAQLQYGMLCQSGTGVEKSAVAAGEWWRKAADQGKPEAQNNLALLYLRGEGFARDDVAGLTWLSKAAQAGYAPSQLYLARIFMQGTDKRSAYYWLRRAADENDPQAIKLLAELTPQMSPEIIAAVDAELKLPVKAPPDQGNAPGAK